MTNMQLAYSEYLENARHNRVAEDTSRMDVVEKQRHNIQSEQLTAAQQALDKYLGELSNEAKHKQIATEADINKLKTLVDAAIRSRQTDISKAELDNATKKLDYEIAKLEAEAKKNEADAATLPENRKATNEMNTAKAAAYNTKAYGTISGIVSNIIGKSIVDDGKTMASKLQKMALGDDVPMSKEAAVAKWQRKYAEKSTNEHRQTEFQKKLRENAKKLINSQKRS